MAEPFVGEIRLFGGAVVPKGWQQCSGQVLQIQQNQALYSIIGIQFGGDGKTTFQLPNLNGRAPLCANPASTALQQGKAAGEATHILTSNEIPAHTHQAAGSTSAADNWQLSGNTWATASNNIYAAASSGAMGAAAIGTTGASAPHQNMQPYLTLNFCIAVSGIYPPRP